LATPNIITDPNDPRIAAYRNIRERDVTGREGRFIIEGDVVLRLALSRGRFPLESVLLSKRRLDNDPELAATVSDVVTLLVADDDVMSGIVGFDIHRGILAVGTGPVAAPLEQMIAGLPANATVIVCIGIANHDNMGGIFRNAAAFGASAIFLDETCCHPLYRKAIRVSVGAALVVPFHLGATATDILEALKQADFTILALSPSGQHAFTDLPPSARTALVLGSEGPGLPDDILSRTTTVRIKMAGGFDSLNVATTSGIALHAIFNR
jgi:tRNA G18 (ribose-2'-O)-methylase SpoU